MNGSFISYAAFLSNEKLTNHLFSPIYNKNLPQRRNERTKERKLSENSKSKEKKAQVLHVVRTGISRS